jgi:hypothetical protein
VPVHEFRGALDGVSTFEGETDQEKTARKARPGLLSEVGGQIKDALVYHLPGAVAGALEGDTPYAERDWKDTLVERSRARAKEVAAEPGAKDPLAFGALSRDDVRSLGPSLGFSGVGALTGLAAGVPATIAGNIAAPVVGTAAGFAAGGAASGKAAYNMSVNQFLRDAREKVDQDAIAARGQPLSDEEWLAAQPQYEEAAKKYGLWEAVPEAVSNMLGAGILTAPVRRMVPKALGALADKNLVTRGATKAGALALEELPSETVTQMGQNNAQVDAGLGQPGDKTRSFTSGGDWWDSFKEIAGPTLLQTAVMGGAGAAGVKAYRSVAGKKDETPGPTVEDAKAAVATGADPKKAAASVLGQAINDVATGENTITEAGATERKTPAEDPARDLEVLRKLAGTPEQRGELSDDDRAYLVARGLAKPKEAGGVRGLPAARRRLRELEQAAPTTTTTEGATDDQSKPDTEAAATDGAQPAEQAGEVPAGQDVPEGKVAEPVGDGTRAAPVEVKTAADVERAAAAASTDYTAPQGEANNRTLGHLTWEGLDGSVEVAEGGERKGADPKTGREWSTKHSAPYGYFKGTKDGDGMHVDAIWGPELDKGHPVYVLDEVDDAGKWRQHKTLPGFPSEQAAREAYLGISSKKPEHIGAITAMPVEQFKTWVKSDATLKPLALGAPSKNLYRGGKPTGAGRLTWMTPDRAAAEQYARLGEDGKVTELAVGEQKLAGPADVRRIASEAGISIPEDQSAYSVLAPEQFGEADKLLSAIEGAGYDGVRLPKGEDFAPDGTAIESVGLFNKPEQQKKARAPRARRAAALPMEKAPPGGWTDADKVPKHGTTNKVFTADAAEKAREILRKKLSGQVNSGLDPEVIQAGITLAGFHIEAGARTFAAYSKAMLEDLGDVVKPYLKSWYLAVRNYPGFDNAGMQSEAELEASDKAKPKVTPQVSGSIERQTIAAENDTPQQMLAKMKAKAASQGRVVDARLLDSISELEQQIAADEKNETPSVPAKREQLYVERGGKRFEVDSLEDASKKWDTFRDQTGAGASEIGEGARIVDQDGKEVARISYNGKVWPPGEYKPGQKPLVGEPFKASEPSVELVIQPLRPGAPAETKTVGGKPSKPVTPQVEAIAGTAPLGSKSAAAGPAMTLGSFKHTKTGATMWAVSLGDRVERPVYDALNAKAKSLGGRFSSFKGGGAIPGFLFSSEAKAREFMGSREAPKGTEEGLNGPETTQPAAVESPLTQEDTDRGNGQPVPSEGLPAGDAAGDRPEGGARGGNREPVDAGVAGAGEDAGAAGRVPERARGTGEAKERNVLTNPDNGHLARHEVLQMYGVTHGAAGAGVE